MTRLLACRHLLLALCVGLFSTSCPTPVAAQPAAGAITGKVAEGSAGQIAVSVFLYDAAGRPVGKAMTQTDGRFAFRGVAPGEYRLFSEKPASGREAKADVKVKAGETVDARLTLRLK